MDFNHVILNETTSGGVWARSPYTLPENAYISLLSSDYDNSVFSPTFTVDGYEVFTNKNFGDPTNGMMRGPFIIGPYAKGSVITLSCGAHQAYQTAILIIGCK